MKKQYLEVGKIVGTHGVRGMVRIQPWCDGIDFLKQFNRFYLDSNGENIISCEKISPNGNVAIAKIKGIDTIEDAEKYRGSIIYINRNDAHLPEGTNFIQDIIGCTVLDYETGSISGEISDVSQTGANDVWHIYNNGKEYLIPVIADVVKEVNVETGIIKIKPLKGIFDDED